MTPTAITFTSDTWATEQLVTIGSVEDSRQHPSPAVFTAKYYAQSTDDDYNFDKNSDKCVYVRVSAYDKDTAQILLRESAYPLDKNVISDPQTEATLISVTEGPNGAKEADNNVFFMKLQTKPVSAVTVSIQQDAACAEKEGLNLDSQSPLVFMWRSGILAS